MSRRSAGRAILLGVLICGVLDISSAIVIAIAGGGSPVRMLQGIAGALLGPATFERGFATAAMGLAMHFCVALTAATVFYLVSRGIPALVDRAWIAGIVFGFVWLLVMYRGVIPLSQVVRTLYLTNVRRNLPALWPLPFFVHIFCVGLPIALAVRDFGPPPHRPS